jgi:Na+/proline symporter
MILQQFVFDAMGIPFVLTVVGMVLLIWLYTRRGRIKTLVLTDTFQTVCLFTALLLIIGHVMGDLGLTMGSAWETIVSDTKSRVFVFDDWVSKQNFWKQLMSGIFVVIVMTGLDQDMMQKNLTCKSLRDAQKDMCTYGVAFLPANLLFLALGVLLVHWCDVNGIALPQTGDGLLPQFVEGTGTTIMVLFTIGLLAASFSSADSALLRSQRAIVWIFVNSQEMSGCANGHIS